MNTIPIGIDTTTGEPIIVKPGRYGPYVKRNDDTASVPDALAPDEMTVEKAMQLLAAPKGDKPIGVDPVTGLNVYAKQGRFGPYVQMGEMTDDKKAEKPKTASLFRTMALEKITLDDALQLLTLPRTLGEQEGKPVTAHNGKFGPYLRWGTETRNMGIENEPKLLTIGMEEAMAVLSQPKQFRGRGQPKPPLATFGPDPVSGKEIVLKEGRFGFYVTDGETNASLRRGDEPSGLNPERAAELLVLRREYMLSPEGQEKAARRNGGKKPRAKKASAAKAPKAEKPEKLSKEKPVKAPTKKAAKDARPAAAVKAKAAKAKVALKKGKAGKKTS